MTDEVVFIAVVRLDVEPLRFMLPRSDTRPCDPFRVACCRVQWCRSHNNVQTLQHCIESLPAYRSTQIWYYKDSGVRPQITFVDILHDESSAMRRLGIGVDTTPLSVTCLRDRSRTDRDLDGVPLPM